METPETTEGAAATTGNGSSELLLPAGHIVPTIVTPAFKEPVPSLEEAIRAADLLHTGNAVVAAQEAAAQSKIQEEKNPVDRNLRESGLKESLPRQGAEPERVVGAADEKDENGLPRIRTYAEDLSEEMKKRGSTLSSIIGAEKARVPSGETSEAAAPHPSRRWIFIAGAVFFVIAGAGAIGAVFFFGQSTNPANAPAQSIIPVNSHAPIALDEKKPLSQTLAEAKESAQIQLGDVEAFDIQKNGAELNVEEMLLALGAPDQLARNATAVLVGIHATDGTAPFIIVSVSAYDLAFQAMLDWEKTMGDTLGTFFAPKGVPADSVSVHAPSLIFTDRVSLNTDVRESQTDWPIIYSFPRQNIVIITTNENTLREILSRLSLQSAGS